MEPSNNKGERAIRPFVLARKNFLFANTTRGANASAIMFSMVQSAKLNNLKVFDCLNYVLETISNNQDEIDLNDLLPYSDQIPKYI